MYIVHASHRVFDFDFHKYPRDQETKKKIESAIAWQETKQTHLRMRLDIELVQELLRSIEQPLCLLKRHEALQDEIPSESESESESRDPTIITSTSARRRRQEV